MIWDQLTFEELHALDRNIPTVLLTAATEQHGGHLPLATDRLIGEHFLRELDKLMAAEVLLLPAVSVGCSEHHLTFTGSLSLTHGAFIQQVESLIESVWGHGFQNMLLFNSHGGNQGVNQVLVEKLGFKYPNKRIVTTSWWRIALDALKDITTSGPGGVGHAGEFETSLMMYIDPKLVREQKIIPGANKATYSWVEGDMLRSAKASYYRTMKEMTPNGIYGDPTHASIEKGRQITEAVVEALAVLIKELRG